MGQSLNVMTPINDLGYGIAGYNILRALQESGCDASLFIIGPPNISDEQQGQLVQRLTDNQNSFDVNAPCLKIWHEFHMGERVGKGPLFGFPFFEINKFDERRINHLKSCDHIAVASQWAKDIVADQIPSYPAENIHVVPLGVDGNVFSSPKPVRTPKCIFLNCGKWEVRKGHDILFHLFQSAFPDNVDVELWMMCGNPFLQEQERMRWEHFYKQDPRIQIIERVPSQKQLASIMSHSTCGIFPSRAEGWNLEILEMMSLGKNIITTNYSAHTEFCNSQNSFLVTPQKNEAAVDGKWFNGEAEWASLDGIHDEFVEHMQNVYSVWKESDGTLVNEEGIKTAKQFSWSNTAQKLMEAIYGNKHSQDSGEKASCGRCNSDKSECS